MVLEMVRTIPWRLRSGTNITAELNTRIEELERLKDQLQALGASIASAVSNGTSILNHDTNPFLPEKGYL